MSLVQRVKENYQEPPPPKRGKKRDFTALSFLLLAAVAVTLRTFSDSELRKLLEKEERLRRAMGFERVPHRTCIGRRLSGLVLEAEQQIALLGQQILEEVKPEADQPKASAIDGRMYKAQGPKWHKSDRQKGLVPEGGAKCRHRFQVVQERLSRLGAGLQARSARAGLPTSSPDLRDLASEQ